MTGIGEEEEDDGALAEQQTRSRGAVEEQRLHGWAAVSRNGPDRVHGLSRRWLGLTRLVPGYAAPTGLFYNRVILSALVIESL